MKNNISSIDKAVRRANRLKNPIAPNQSDLANWILYDTVTAANNTTTATQYQMFSVPQNQGGKTKAQTNMQLPQQLQAPQWMNVQTIGFEFSADTYLPDLVAMLKAYWFEFWVGQKIYAEGPLESAMSGYGVAGFSSAATTASATTISESVVNNGVPSGAPSFSLVLPPGIGDGTTGVTILQSQSFYVNLLATTGVALTINTGGGTGLTLKCYLTGILSRGVQ